MRRPPEEAGIPAHLIVNAMAAILRNHGTDLGDAREVIMALMNAGFGARSIDYHMDEAVDRCRAIQAGVHGWYQPPDWPPSTNVE